MRSKGIGILTLVLIILVGVGLLLFSLCGGFSHAATFRPMKLPIMPGPTTRPAEGLTYQTFTRADPPLRAFALKIDLTDPAVHVVALPAGPDPDGAGPWQMQLFPVRRVAGRERLAVAVNANFFRAKDAVEIGGESSGYYNGNAADVVGWQRHAGETVGQPWGATLVVTTGGAAKIGLFNQLPADAAEAVSGSSQILNNGRITVNGRDASLAPRTAAGVADDGKTLVLLVVDGRRPKYSAGATLGTVADLMKQLGCTDAINLDGGGSSTMVLSGAGGPRVVNTPSDGSKLPFGLSRERPVANVLGVRVDPPKPH